MLPTLPRTMPPTMPPDFSGPFYNLSTFSPLPNSYLKGLPGIQSLRSMGSPNSEVGRMKHTLAAHFGGMRKVPLSILALVADSKNFRVNNLALQKGLETGFQIADGVSVEAKKDPGAWALAMVKSRFSDINSHCAAVMRFQSVMMHLIHLGIEDKLHSLPVHSTIAYEMALSHERKGSLEVAELFRRSAELYASERFRDPGSAAVDMLRSAWAVFHHSPA